MQKITKDMQTRIQEEKGDKKSKRERKDKKNENTKHKTQGDQLATNI